MPLSFPTRSSTSPAHTIQHEIHMVKKPCFEPGPGEMTIHVRATGICRYIFLLSYQTGMTSISGSMALLGLPCLSHMSVEHVIDRQAKSLPSERALRSGRSADRVANGVPCGLASCDPCRTGRLMLRRELIGLVVTLLAAHAAGCPLIVISDLFPSRLEFAKKLLPPARTVQIEKTAKLEEVRKQIKDEAGMEFSLALDYTRMESSIRSAIFVKSCMIDVFEVANPDSIASTVCQG
ncbi:hypothetical protein I311_00807 [Cryptococcus gattii NT-10]|nr:hypothetical protein I311_00807 [Cryptococcus gattii NT-10]